MGHRCWRPRWEMVGTLYKEPPALSNVEGASHKTLTALLYGVTTITQRCVKCGWVTSETIPGKALHPYEKKKD